MEENNLPRKSIKSRIKIISRTFVVVIVLSIILFFSKNKLKALVDAQNSQTGGQLAKETKSVNSQIVSLDKKFYFPAFNDAGKKKGTIELRITEVEKTDEVIVQDKNYSSKNDKTFLIVNLELKNETPQRLNIFPGDLMRLIVDDQEEKKYAPDLHNNYVLVSPISTKIDRVGFVIDKIFDNLKLQVGELEEKKEILEIQFPT